MKTTTVVALLAVISAVSVGAISMSTSPSVVLASGSISPESGSIMGHVEYVVRDSSGNIKQYLQSDNEVTDIGDNCVIAYAFQTGETPDTCTVTADGFAYIGIGNATKTGTYNGTMTTLAADGSSDVIANTSIDGLMAVKQDTDTVASAGTDGSTVVISTETPFNFDATTGAVTNATTVRSAGLFDAACTTDATSGHCTAGTGANMFSAQPITVVVGDGDSLDVTWTITVGDAT